jgi:hypothetical protein
MPGICPNCIKLVQEGDTCPDCRGPLISAGAWNERKDQFLPRTPPPPPVPVGPAPGEPAPGAYPTVAPAQQSMQPPPGRPNQPSYPAVPPFHQPAPPPAEHVPFFFLRFLLGGASALLCFLAILVMVQRGMGGL